MNLLERLQQRVDIEAFKQTNFPKHYRAELLQDLNDAIAAVKALEVAKKALEPFANLDGEFKGTVVEVCQPHPENPSRRIEPVLAITFTRAHEAFVRLEEVLK